MIEVLPDKFRSVGNPYASPVDFTKINKGASVQDVFYLWDPFIAGPDANGGYQTYSAVNGWKPVPGGTLPHPSGVAGTVIQSGEAFFVHGASAGSGTDFQLYFTENAKVAENPSTFSRKKGGVSTTAFFRTSLLNTNGDIIDGIAVAFDEKYDDAVDAHDALKIAVSGENFGLKREGKLFSIEARSEIVTNDTLFFNLTGLAKKSYRFLIQPENMNEAVQAYLVDNYFEASVPINLSNDLEYEFSVNNDPASYSPNRFLIAFDPQFGTLGVTFLNISATLNQEQVMIAWSVADEKNVKEYRVERSIDGANFQSIGVYGADALMKGEYTFTDTDPDGGVNYYRIMSIDTDGKYLYSSIARVSVNHAGSSIRVFPNPVTDNRIKVHFTDQLAGDYVIRLFNTVGQEVLTRTSKLKGHNEQVVIELKQNVQPGIYNMTISNKGINVKTFVIQVK